MPMVRGTARGVHDYGTGYGSGGTWLWWGVRGGGYMTMVGGTARRVHDYGTGYG